MVADATVEADRLDDLRSIEPTVQREGVQLVEERHARSEIGVSKELDRFRLFDGAGKDWRNLNAVCTVYALEPAAIGVCEVRAASADNHARRAQAVLERAALPQELGVVDRSSNTACMCEHLGCAGLHGGAEHHDGVGAFGSDLQEEALDDARIESTELIGVVGGNGDDDHVEA